jgi:GntR family transcriptional regulator
VFQFDLQPSAAVPLYRQIAEQVERAIAGKTLKNGDELPSVRAVAEQHVINPMTVSKAYALLEQRGLIERRKGIGMYVNCPDLLGDEAIKLLQPIIKQTALSALQMKVSTAKAVVMLRDEMIRLSGERKDRT